MDETTLLETIAALSREFGTETYVRGGGGNTSAKNAETMWIKPSGITLAEMTPAAFLPLERSKIDILYTADIPADANGREAAVKTIMENTILPGHQGRPSVEAPLHNSFAQRFVVHTHPTMVNGMTCGRNGEAAVARLFPDALYVPFVEPGYTLTMKIRNELILYQERYGNPPSLVFLGNHGVFIAHDEADGIRSLYKQVMDSVGAEVEKAGIGQPPIRKPLPPADKIDPVVALVRDVLGDDAKEYAVAGWFPLQSGPISPDHIVYSKSWLYEDELTKMGLQRFKEQHSYYPRVVATGDAVFGFGPSRKVAELAIDLAWDATLVEHYARAFGGIHYLEPKFVDFIENWEVESYRQKMAK